MPLKKVGIVSAGVTAALLTASPLAFAGDYPTGSKSTGPEVEGASTKPGTVTPGHGPHGPNVVDVSKTCAFKGGNAGAGSVISGPTTLLNGVLQAPVAASNIADLANCSDFLNNNLNHNLSDNQIAVGHNLLR